MDTDALQMHPDVTLTEVDGVPTLLAPRAGSQVAAGLVFRVGWADETLPTRGITHLVEHLALHHHGGGDLHYNGATADGFTHFHVEGSPEHVVEYLNGVCSSLVALPMHRLETEKEILRTEATGRSAGAAPELALYRYGAQGYGLSSYEELGLGRLDADQVQDWARRHFTRENAVLWITDDRVPDGLRLDLPRGWRNPPPPVTSALPATPAWLPAPDRNLVMEAIVPRSTAARIYTQVLSKALWAELRQRSGYSYTATAQYHPRDPDHASIVALVDALPEKRDPAIGAFVDVLARLRFGRITPAELESARATVRLPLSEPDLGTRTLPALAVDLLSGRDGWSPAGLEAEIADVTVEDLQDVAAQVHASALVQVPSLGLDWAGFVTAPQFSERAVTGATFHTTDPDTPYLVVAGDGVSLVQPGGPVTVLFRHLAAALSYPDGGLRLIGTDGFLVPVEPTFHGIDARTMERLHAAIPRELVVPMPARDPERIPRPEVKRPEPRARRRAESRTGHRAAESRAERPPARRGPVRTTVGVVLLLVTCLFLTVAIGSAVDAYENTDPELSRGDLVGTTVFVLVLTGFLAWPTWRLLRPRR